LYRFSVHPSDTKTDAHRSIFSQVKNGRILVCQSLTYVKQIYTFSSVIAANSGQGRFIRTFSPEWVRACYGLATATLSDGGSVTPCEPLSNVIARHTPAAAAEHARRTSNGRDRHPSNGRPSSAR
jgi:hypothetical protein